MLEAKVRTQEKEGVLRRLGQVTGTVRRKMEILSQFLW